MLIEDEELEEDEPHAGLYKILSGVGLAAALVLFVTQLLIAQIWIKCDAEKDTNPRYNDWTQLFE